MSQGGMGSGKKMKKKCNDLMAINVTVTTSGKMTQQEKLRNMLVFT